MFLCAKSAPGGAEKIVPSETRESLIYHRVIVTERTEKSVYGNGQGSRIITNLHPRNKYSGYCPFLARSFNKLGLVEFVTAERKYSFPSARYSRSGNLAAVSFKRITAVELFPLPWVGF